MFSSDGILKELVKEQLPVTSNKFSFCGMLKDVSDLPVASEKHNGKMYAVRSCNGNVEIYMCFDCNWEKVNTLSLRNSTIQY